MASIVSQQLSTKAAATIYERFISLYEDKIPHPEHVSKTDVETLRGCGLSGQKAGYVKNLAEYFLQNSFDKKTWMAMSDEEIVKELTSIKGIGVWTVQMTLMFTLDRKDVLPLDDLIIKNSITKYYGLDGSGKEQVNKIIAVAEKWRPYRSVAYMYLWAAKDGLK